MLMDDGSQTDDEWGMLRRMVKQQFTVEISPLVDYICGDEAAILSLYQ